MFHGWSREDDLQKLVFTVTMLRSLTLLSCQLLSLHLK